VILYIAGGATVGYPAPVFPDNHDRCSLCWFQFSLFRRPHHCRLCDALTCDECSKKRVLIEYQQVRGNVLMLCGAEFLLLCCVATLRL
jgi:hypothetical protein